MFNPIGWEAKETKKTKTNSLQYSFFARNKLTGADRAYYLDKRKKCRFDTATVRVSPTDGGIAMIDSFFQYLFNKLHSVTLWGYGWKRRKTIVLSRSVDQWQDPLTGMWYGEKVALRLLRVNVLDYYRRQ